MDLKVLVIEDSLVFQKIISTVLKDIDGVDEVAVAGTGQEGLDLIARGKPDVVFLDLHLPDMDGMDILDELKKRGQKQRVVVVSGLSVEGADLTIKALSKGAQQFVRKPSGAGFQASVAELRSELEPIIKTVSLQVKGSAARASVPATAPKAVGSALPAAPKQPSSTEKTPGVSTSVRTAPRLGGAFPAAAPAEGIWVTAIAVSTGGPQALTHIIPKLPPLFTDSLAKSLDAKSKVKVVEAQAGMVLEAGTVYIAPGGQHLVIKKVDAKPVAALNEDPPEQSVRPAADVLFRSLAHYQSLQAVLSVVLTGMGEDGLVGVRALKLTGCHCLTQAEDTCVVYGMPRAVDAAGLSDEQLPLDALADRMVQLVSRSRTRVGV